MLTEAIVETHSKNEPDSFGSMMISFPLSSSGGLISKTCKTIAMLMNSPASPKCLPGQTLPVHIQKD